MLKLPGSVVVGAQLGCTYQHDRCNMLLTNEALRIRECTAYLLMQLTPMSTQFAAGPDQVSHA